MKISFYVFFYISKRDEVYMTVIGNIFKGIQIYTTKITGDNKSTETLNSSGNIITPNRELLMGGG